MVSLKLNVIFPFFALLCFTLCKGHFHCKSSSSDCDLWFSEKKTDVHFSMDFNTVFSFVQKTWKTFNRWNVLMKTSDLRNFFSSSLHFFDKNFITLTSLSNLNSKSESNEWLRMWLFVKLNTFSPSSSSFFILLFNQSSVQTAQAKKISSH